MGEKLKVPDEWCCANHMDIAEINPKFGINQFKEDVEVSFLPMASVEEVSGNYDLSQSRKFSAVKKGYTHFKNGDIIFAKITPCMENGKIAVLDNLLNGIGFGSTEFHVSRPHNDINTQFLFYYFVQSAFRNKAQRAMTGSAGQLRVSTEYFKNVNIPIPSLSEQRAIVSKIEQLFSDLDNGIANFKKAQEQLKRYRQSVLKNACEGRLVPTEAELARNEGRDYEPAEVLLARILEERREKWNGKGKYKEPAAPDTSGLAELPDGWVWANVGQIAIVGTGATPLTSEKEYYENGTIPWITSSALNDSYIKEPNNFVTEKALQETNISLYPKHTMLVAMYGEGKTRGKCSELLIEASTNQAIAALVLDGSSGACRYFLKIFLIKNYDATRMKSSGGVQPNLNLGLVRKVINPLPPLAEQQRIVTEVERCLSLCDNMETTIAESLQKAESLRQSILKKAFEGKLLNEKELEEVRNAPDWEPAEKLVERIRQEKQIKENNNKPTRRKTYG